MAPQGREASREGFDSQTPEITTARERPPEISHRRVAERGASI